MRAVLAALLGAAVLAVCQGQKVIDLSDSRWLMENGNRSIKAYSLLPAYPLEVLRKEGKIDSPLHRYGELTTRWVALDNWTFSLSFDGSSPDMKQLRDSKEVLLKLGGVDTFGAVTLNGKEVLRTNNFHRHWSVPVKQLLVPGTNTLQIGIIPAMQESLRLKQDHPYSIPSIHQMGSIGAYTFVRKPASDLGWDWGPAFAASGVHGKVELVGYDTAILDDSYMSQRKVGSTYELTVTSKLLVPPGGDEGELTVELPELQQQQTTHVTLLDSSSPDARVATVTNVFVLPESGLNLWWPVGYGSPNLYNLTITYTPKSAVPVCTSAVPESAAAGGAADSAWSFKVLAAADLPQTSFTSKAMRDQAGCEQWCASTAECSFFTYAPAPESYCWLNKGQPEPAATFGIKGTSDDSYRLLPSTTLKGFDLSATTAASSDACQAMCSALDACIGFVFLNKKCTLKKAQEAGSNRVLGFKVPPAPAAATPSPVEPQAAAAEAQQPAAAETKQPEENKLPAAEEVKQPAAEETKQPTAEETKQPTAEETKQPAEEQVTQPEETKQPAEKPSTAAAASSSSDEVLSDPAAFVPATDSQPSKTQDTKAAATPAAATPAAATPAAATLAAATPAAATLAAQEQPTTPTDKAADAAVTTPPADAKPATTTPPATAAPKQVCSAPSASATASSRSHRIGFRTVELVRLPISEAVGELFPDGQTGWDPESDFGVTKAQWDGSWALTKSGRWDHVSKPGNGPEIEGESFYFKVNGVPIFIKGANLVPLNILPTNVTAEMVADVLSYALDSNMNMVRIWGGGLYPGEELFEFADQHGLLVWMETMFACAPYPRDPAFLDNVAAEVTQQVQRLSWHPSVGIWAGNNEIEGSFNWYAESRSNKQLFAGDYISLFVDTIRQIIKKTQPAMAFVDSSPSNGVIADDDRQYIKRWGEDWDPRYGDIHYYAYDDDCEDYSTYPKAKFVSEFGSQSFPTFPTYAEVTAVKDWQVDNPMTGFRNRRFGNGLEMFEKQFKRHFRLPESWSAPDDPLEAFRLFKSFFYITHMQQSRCYEAAINYWRRLRSQPAGLTMGVLYWQLNDIAQFASWSGYDYGGRWKPLAYTIKRIYAPLVVQAITDGEWTKIFLVNDHTSPVSTALTIRLLSLEDEAGPACAPGLAATTPVAQVDYVVPPSFASVAWTMKTAELLASRPGCSVTTCYLAVSAVGTVARDPSTTTNGGDASATTEATVETSEAQLFFVPLKDINLPDPALELTEFTTVEPPAGTTLAPGSSAPVSFLLQANRPAALTSLVTKLKGRFSDDALTALHPCEPKAVTFFPKPGVSVTAKELKAALTAESLFDHQFGEAVTAPVTTPAAPGAPGAEGSSGGGADAADGAAVKPSK